jgi:hypothetical protein
MLWRPTTYGEQAFLTAYGEIGRHVHITIQWSRFSDREWDAFRFAAAFRFRVRKPSGSTTQMYANHHDKTASAPVTNMRCQYPNGTKPFTGPCSWQF